MSKKVRIEIEIPTGPPENSPAMKIPALVRLSCQNCKLDCNGCQNCHYGVEEFLTCELVPKDCTLRFNIRKRTTSVIEPSAVPQPIPHLHQSNSALRVTGVRRSSLYDQLPTGSRLKNSKAERQYKRTTRFHPTAEACGVSRSREAKSLLCRLGLHKWKFHRLPITDPRFIPSFVGVFHPPIYANIIKVCKRCGAIKK